jgi:UDP-glucose 4-epimerase
MAVLVTGGAGYIGSHMVWELLDAGEEVVVLDRLSTGFEWAVAPEAKLVVGDIGDSALVAGIIRDHAVDAIIHFAGSIVVPESVPIRSAIMRTTPAKTRALLEAAVRGRAAFHLFVDRRRLRIGRHGAGREDARLAPESPYGRSKLMSEWMLPTPPTRIRCYTALRYFNVAGRRSKRAHRTVDAGRHASDQGRLRDGARQARPR